METNLLQLIGYFASIVIAISMTLSSIIKFRWINLFGALTFSIYGFLIGTLPVGLLNAFIASVDIYYLINIYTQKEIFEILEVRADNKYLLRFLKSHHKDIQRFFPDFTYKAELNTISFFILRDATVAGLFLAHREDDNILKVGLDFVLPEYRDFKNGRFIYAHLRKRFIKYGYKVIKAPIISKKYSKYLLKIGFTRDQDGMYKKVLLDTDKDLAKTT